MEKEQGVKEFLGWGRGWHSYFTQMPNEVYDPICSLTPYEVMVYGYLLSCVNEQRNGCKSWPSYPTIVKHTRISRSVVIKSIKILSEKLYINKESRLSDSHGTTSNMYYINHPSYSTDFRDNRGINGLIDEGVL